MISDPANALGALAGKAHLKYLETKAVVGGTTAIQGTAKTGRPYEGWLVRNIEYETFQTKKKTVYVSALPLRDEAAYKSQAAAPQGQAGLRLPPVRGHGPQAHRRVHDDEHRALPRPGPGGHPLHGAREGQLRRVGAARRRGRVVAVLQPVALRRDHRRPRRPRRRRAHLPGRRLVALGLEEPPRRAQGRRHVEPHAPQRRADGAGDLRDGHLQPGRRHQLGRQDRATEGRPARRRPRHHRPPRRPLREPRQVDRARRAARGHQRPALLRHHASS